MNIKEDAPYIIGGIVVLGVIFALMNAANSGSSAPSQSSVSYQVVGADPNVLAQETQEAVAKDSTISSVLGGVFGLETAEAADSAQVQVAGTQAADALASNVAGYNAQTAIAATQSSAAQALASTQSAEAQALAVTQANAQVAQTGLTTAAQKAIAGDQQAAVSAQAKAQQQSSFWNGLFGAVGGVAKDIIPFFEGSSTGAGSGSSGGSGGSSGSSSLPSVILA